MARKIIDTYPVFRVTVGAEAKRFEHKPMTPEEALQAQAEFAEMLDDLRAQTRRQFDVESTIKSEAVCEHCRYAWTEASADFNGGCCGKDEANDPKRLAEMRETAEGVSDGYFYHYNPDTGRAGKVAINWPDQFGCAVVVWLDAGRPEADVRRLLSLAKRVTASDWCTIWEDPGPSGCSLPRQPDRVTVDHRPNHLADELCSLLDDMGLLPARQAVA